MAASAAAYNYYSSEYHCCCQHLLPCDGVHSDCDAYHYRDDRLDIAVHADKSRPDPFLGDGYEEIGDEGGADDQICQFGILGRRDGGPFHGRQTLQRQRSGNACREKEYPFHECHGRIFRDEGLEYSQIHREAQAVEDDHEDTERSAFHYSSGSCYPADYKVDDAGEAYSYSAGFFHCYGFLDRQRGYSHGIDGRHRCQDRAVHGSDVRDSDQEGHLACEESQHRCREDPDVVLPVDLLFRHECRYRPEQRACHQRPYREYPQRRDQMSARKVLAYYYVEAEKGIGNECRSMPYDMVFCCHVILLLKFCGCKFTYFSLPLFITFQVRMKAIEVAAAIIVKDDKVFATQRGYGEWQGWWEFPGGKIEAGESPQEALVREIREELDAEIEVGELLETVEWDYPNFHLTMHCFMCSLISESMHLNEHEAAAWLTRGSLRSVKWLPADEGLVSLIEELL